MFAPFSYFFIKKYKEQRNGGKRNWRTIHRKPTSSCSYLYRIPSLHNYNLYLPLSSRSLSKTLSTVDIAMVPRLTSAAFRHTVFSPSLSSSRLLIIRSQYSRYSSSSSPDIGDASDPLVGKLEDVIHGIVVRRSEPEWLPFRPGSSYWVPPRSRSRGMAQLIGKLVNVSPTNLNPDDSTMPTTIHPCGWPDSSYFVHGK